MKNIILYLSLSIAANSAFAASNLDHIEGKDLFKMTTVQLNVGLKKGLVVLFLSAKCPCSHSHIGELKSLVKDYPEFSFVAIHSNVSEDLTLSRSYFENAELPFQVIQDEKTQIADRFKALKTPHAFVIKPGGIIAYQGGVSSSRDFSVADRKFLREALDDISHGRNVKTPEGRTLGCAITRGN